jgi:hypothetical protein
MIGVQILWKKPYQALNHQYFIKASYRIRNYETLQFNKFYNMIFYLLPSSSKQLLIENDVVPLTSPLSNKPLFNYISFSSEISTFLINDMGLALIKEVNSHKFQEKFKILEQEFYKLFISNCKNILDFRWTTTLPLHQYPGAITCFSQLRTLGFTFDQSLTSEKLFRMSQICQSIEDLKLWRCNRDNSGLIEFIDNQKNLQSLDLNNKYYEMEYIQLSEAIERKAATLKKFILNNVLLPPKFFPSLINLEHLELEIEKQYYSDQDDVQKLQNYLSISSFPKLQYLKVKYLLARVVCKLIENSLGSIKDVKLWIDFEVDDDNIKLFKAIAKNCPNIENLDVNSQLKNVGSIKEIFLNCSKLRKLSLPINFNEYDNDDNYREFICDEVLNILSNYSSKTFEEFSFDEEWRFSVNALKNFFESWRGRKPIKFVTRFDRCYHFTQEHIRIVEKYYDEGVIDKETSVLYGVKY